MKNVIIDVDTGIDDALAILLAVKSEELNILGITTAGGNVNLKTATENTRKVLNLLGEEGLKIPVVPGANRPYLRPPVHEHNVHGKDGLGGVNIPTPDVPVKDQFAPDYIIDTVKHYKNNITLIMTAPLTNLALALQKAPEIVELVDEVIFMGGNADTFGNATPTAEFNMYADPEAAKIVFESGLPLTMVGLDVTRKALLYENHIEELVGTHLYDFVKGSTARYINRYEHVNGIRACAMHDPLAVAVAIDPSIVKSKKYFVAMETRSEYCDGMTVCDFQNRFEKEPNMNVCLEVDSDQFIELFIKYLIKPLD